MAGDQTTNPTAGPNTGASTFVGQAQRAASELGEAAGDIAGRAVNTARAVEKKHPKLFNILKKVVLAAAFILSAIFFPVTTAIGLLVGAFMHKRVNQLTNEVVNWMKNKDNSVLSKVLAGVAGVAVSIICPVVPAFMVGAVAGAKARDHFAPQQRARA